MNEVFSIHTIQVTIENIIQKAMGKSEPTIKLPEDMLEKSQVVGLDESRCHDNKKPNWT